MKIFMNYTLSYRKEPKLSFTKKFAAAIIIFFLAFIFSCNEKEQKRPAHKLDLNSTEALIKEAKKVLGNDTQVALSGHFDEDNTKEVVAGTEINKPDKWGIEFHLLKVEDDTLAPFFSTGMLEGSFTDAAVKVERSLYSEYDLIYYNSLDYYLGSGGGEVFAYLIDFNKKQTFYSHLIIEKGRKISLFLSENSTPVIKNYFLSIFKKDYPNLAIIERDINLDE